MNSVIEDLKITKFREGLTQTGLAFRKDILENVEQVLNTTDFPTTRDERWKYTRVTKISNKIFNEQGGGSISELSLPLKDAFTIVFVNGVYEASLSSSESQEGITITPLSQLKENSILGTVTGTRTDIFTALNTMYAADGIAIEVKAKAVVEKPVQVVHMLKGEGVIANFRTLIVADKFAEAAITQVFLSEAAVSSFTNVVTEVIVGENAKITLDKIQYETEENFHIAAEYIRQAASSNFKINTITLNGGLVRNNLFIDVEGQNVETHLNGAYILKGNQHVDNHTTVDHLQANCESNELYKGVVDDTATAVFNGKVFVRKDAQKINAYQSNGNVLLSDTAAINSKPELEIYADDVKCSHGSTTGQLDEEAVFYLRARGLSEKSARALMVTAFISDVIDKVDNEETIDYIHSILEERFGWSF